MSKTWLLIDVSFLCYRHFHALNYLPTSDIGDGVIFGFLRDIVKIQERHDCENIAFCFDRGISLRRDIYPEYKASRVEEHQKESNDESKRRQKLRRKMKQLRRLYLKEIGYKNVFAQLGYEADDIIASICLHSLKDNKAIIVTRDHDFFQLLTHNVSIWNPMKQQMTTFKTFRKKYQLEPEQWHLVKALSGCNSDNVKGIKGVGESTAVKFVRGVINEKHKIYNQIISNMDIFKRNLSLVKLPFEDVSKFKLISDEVTHKKWREFGKSMKMKELLSISPYGIRQEKKR